MRVDRAAGGERAVLARQRLDPGLERLGVLSAQALDLGPEGRHLGPEPIALGLRHLDPGPRRLGLGLEARPLALDPPQLGVRLIEPRLEPGDILLGLRELGDRHVDLRLEPVEILPCIIPRFQSAARGLEVAAYAAEGRVHDPGHLLGGEVRDVVLHPEHHQDEEGAHRLRHHRHQGDLAGLRLPPPAPHHGRAAGLSWSI